MANEEHLALLKQGVDAWNEWKANNPDIRPNLSFATGNGLTIRGAKLSGIDLSRTNLSRADLGKADLIGANLTEANLSEAYLSQVDLIGANLTRADLTSADLISANLIGANLSMVYLSGADLTKANLSGTDLIGAKFIGAKLSGANLSGANLSGANLSGAYLRGANLKGANLSMANLSGVNLQRAKALATNFHKAILTGTCLEDWHTNSATNFEDVICDYVYLQAEREERYPSQGNFAQGEFTKLFQKPLETVDLIFHNGIEWEAFLTSFQKLQVERGGNELCIQAIENKKNGAFIIRLTIPPDANKAEVENYLTQEYESELQSIDQKYRYQLQTNYAQIAAYRQQSADLTEIIKVMAGRTANLESEPIVEPKSLSEVSNDDQPNVQNGSLNNTEGADSRQQYFQKNYAPEIKQSLTYTATKILKLLQQLDQTYPINTPLEKQMVVTEVLKRIESNPTLKERVVGALKGVSTEALKDLIDHPLVNLLLAALEGYQEVD